jgi:hypothetical protein
MKHLLKAPLVCVLPYQFLLINETCHRELKSIEIFLKLYDLSSNICILRNYGERERERESIRVRKIWRSKDAIEAAP